MSQLNVNVVAPLGYTGPDLLGDNNFVQVVDNAGTTIFKAGVQNNVSVGTNALDSVTTGQRNIAIGFSAATNITTSSDVIAIGDESLKNATAGGNIAIGRKSLLNLGASSFNVSIGNNSLTSITSGANNTSIGHTSGADITSGLNNAFLGANSGASFSSGSNNTFVGCQSANILNLQTGDNNILIGSGLTVPSAVNVSDEITLGNSSHTVIRAAVTTITSLSDERDKDNIKELSAGLDFINEIKPISFVWKDRDENGKQGIKDSGFTAQNLKEVQNKYNLSDELKLVYESNPDKLEASYGRLIPVLVKAIQELSAEVKQLKSK